MNIEEFEQEFKEFILLYEKETGKDAIYDGEVTEEFKRAFKEYKKQFKQETGKNVIWKGKITKRFKRWANSKLEELNDERLGGKTLVRQNVGDLNSAVIRHIPEEYYDIIVIIDTNKTEKDGVKHTMDFINERYVHYQLGLDILPEITQRQIWYIINKIWKIGGIKANEKFGATSIRKTITATCEHISQYVMKDLFWGEVRDLLKIYAKARPTLYKDVNVESEKGDIIHIIIPLDAKTIKLYEDVPFFFIICEKEDILKSILIELKEQRGYELGNFYGINTQGVTAADVIKLLKNKYKNTKNFHFFILHDLDPKGLEIFFGLRIYSNNNCESIAINPEFLDFSGFKYEELCEEYKVKGRVKKESQEDYEQRKIHKTANPHLIKGAHTRLNKIKNLEDGEKKKFEHWIELCSKRKIELDAVVAKKIEETLEESKVKDFVDYLVHKIETSKWNLNRFRKLKKWEGQYWEYDNWTIKTKLPRVDISKFIEEFKENNKGLLDDKVNEEHKDYLEAIEEIGDLITNNTEDIEGKLWNLKNAEEKVVDNIIEEITKEHPKIFNVDWKNLLPNTYPEKIKNFNKLIRKFELYIQFRGIEKHIELEKELEDYDGLIKGNTPENVIAGKENKLKVYMNDNEKKVGRRRNSLNQIMRIKLRRTTEYKEAKVDVVELKKELGDRVVKEDKRVGVLNDFKEKLEKIYKDLITELEKLEDDEKQADDIEF